MRSWNAGATEIFGCTAEEVIGRVSPIVPEDELSISSSTTWSASATGETMRDLDVRRLHRDGSLIDVSISAGPIRDAHGDRRSARSR